LFNDVGCFTLEFAGGIGMYNLTIVVDYCDFKSVVIFCGHRDVFVKNVVPNHDAEICIKFIMEATFLLPEKVEIKS
jgi:hypothetical protein